MCINAKEAIDARKLHMRMWTLNNSSGVTEQSQVTVTQNNSVVRQPSDDTQVDEIEIVPPVETFQIKEEMYLKTIQALQVENDELRSQSLRSGDYGARSNAWFRLSLIDYSW